MRELKSEFIKIRSIRATYGVALGAIAIGFIGGQVLIQPIAEGQWVPMQYHPFLAMFMTLVSAFAYVIGARAVTDEFAHGTMTWTALATPKRGRSMMAKMAVHGVVGAIVGAATAAAAAATVILYSNGHSDALAVGAGDVIPVVAWASVVAAAWSIIGVGAGALIRHQAGALVGGLAWILVGESVAGGLLKASSKYLPGEAGFGVLGVPVKGLLSRGDASLVLGAVVLAIMTAGIAAMRKSEIA